MVSRCFPGGYNVKLYISRGRLAWWLLAFLCCATFISCSFYISSFSFLVHRWFSRVLFKAHCLLQFIKKDLRQCEIISGCIYWHFEPFLNLCWMLSIAAKKVCIWPMLSLNQWRMTTVKKESSGNTHGTLHHSHHLFTTVQKQKNMERSLYGKLPVISLEAVWIETLPNSL